MTLNDDKIYLTKEGLEKLKEELRILMDEKRVEVAQKIKAARDFGDISENSAYDDAMNQKAFIEGKINELEEIIKNAIVNDTAAAGKVVVGSKVKVHLDGKEDVFHLVGAPEANPMQKKISYESPLGAALMGKKPGETIEFDAPIGKLTYTVVSVE